MNKWVVVTGATRGIGRAIAEKFAAAGHNIIATARNAEDLSGLQSSLETSAGVKVAVFPADLSVTADTQKFINFVEAQKVAVDVLVNNAGYFVPGKITEETEGTLEKMITANVYSAYHVTRGLLTLIPKKQGSHIFNMCSIASFMAYPNGGSYTISKFALLGFSKVLREELKPEGIRVTSVMPGATMTSSWEGSGVPDERLMKASDIADTVFMTWSLSHRSVVEEIIIRPQLGDL